jgi:PqqD family protein of HPr-rel-A system
LLSEFNHTLSILPAPSAGIFSLASRVFCHFWHDEAVVYHELSAQTHLIDGIGAVILQQLSLSSSSYQTLSDALQQQFEFDNGADLDPLLTTTLTYYQQLALVKQYAV